MNLQTCITLHRNVTAPGCRLIGVQRTYAINEIPVSGRRLQKMPLPLAADTTLGMCTCEIHTLSRCVAGSYPRSVHLRDYSNPLLTTLR